MLKFEVDEVPVGLESYYQQDQSGKYRLQVEGVVPKTELDSVKTKLDEFRQTNITLKKQLEELDGMDLVADAKSGTKVKETIENLVQQRVGSMKQKFEQDLNLKDQVLTKASQKLTSVLLADAVKTAAMNHGVVPGAVDDVLARALTRFKVDEEFNVVPVDGAGDADGKPLSIETFVTDLKGKAPHLFAPSEGTGRFQRSRGQSPTKPEASRAERLAGFLKK